METKTENTQKKYTREELKPMTWYLVKILKHSNKDLLGAEVKAKFGGSNYRTLYTGMFIYFNDCEVIRPLRADEIKL